MPQSTFAARWFDGRNAAGTDAELAVADGILRAQAGERHLEFSMADVRTSAPIKGVPLRLGVPDGGVFVLADAAVDPQALGVAAPQGFVHRLERTPVVVVFAVASVIAFGVLAYRLAIPWLGARIAERVPIEAEVTLGTAALASLDGLVFRPTTLLAEQRADLQARFDRLVDLAHLPRRPQLVFRSSQLLGANALALPGGTVLVTDQLVERVDSPDEVAAVFAHELGHIAHRHTMRRLLEQSASWLILGAVLNDVSGIGSLVAAAPALLIRLNFSRQDEEEADDYALMLLPQAGLSPSLLADLLEAISSPECSKVEAGAKGSAGKCSRVRRDRAAVRPAYLSTHPDIQARIARARAVAN